MGIQKLGWCSIFAGAEGPLSNACNALNIVRFFSTSDPNSRTIPGHKRKIAISRTKINSRTFPEFPDFPGRLDTLHPSEYSVPKTERECFIRTTKCIHLLGETFAMKDTLKHTRTLFYLYRFKMS